MCKPVPSETHAVASDVSSQKNEMIQTMAKSSTLQSQTFPALKNIINIIIIIKYEKQSFGYVDMNRYVKSCSYNKNCCETVMVSCKKVVLLGHFKEGEV